jgi:hypothetical protein
MHRIVAPSLRGTRLKKLAFLGGAAGLGIVAVLGIHSSRAADHGDALSLVPLSANAPGNPMADLNDVYAWMTTDATNVNLALTVSPFDNLSPVARHFSPSVVYAFHITSRPGFGMPGMESKIICKFVDDTNGECWVTDPSGKTIDYVKGDLSIADGRLSASGKFRVFAGKRSDPFFFNSGGTKAAVVAAETLCGGGNAANGRCPPGSPGGTFQDDAGCFKADAATANVLRQDIKTQSATNRSDTPCNDTTNIDCFISANVMAIVIQIDKEELLLGADKHLSVWASTHAGS